jgi:L-asparaginase
VKDFRFRLAKSFTNTLNQASNLVFKPMPQIKNTLKKVLILQTGGTIMMQSDVREPGEVQADPNKARGYLLSQVPELGTIAQLSVKELFYEDSSSLTPKHWEQLIHTILAESPSFDGIVVLHGTDTMAYTASALSFALRGLNKPVIFTGSQVPLTTLRSDARRNLINAVQIATYDIPEVCICFNDRLFRGNRSTKMSIGDFDAFASPNLPPLAEIGLNIELSSHIRSRTEASPLAVSFSEEIMVMKLFPGLNPSFLNSILQTPFKALIIEGFGSGNFPIKGRHSLITPFKDLIGAGKILIMCSQAPFDAVDLHKYESGRIAVDLGIISAGSMTMEAATTKIMYLLGQLTDNTTTRQHFLLDLAGEIE